MPKHSSCVTCGANDLQPLKGYEEAQLVTCRACSLVFCSEIPTHQELVDYYDGYSRDRSTIDSPMSTKSRDELYDTLEPYRKTGRVLDVGCGVGLTLDHAQRRGWTTYGTEFTDEAIRVCREAGHVMHQGLLRDQPFEAGSFDVIIYSEVIEHINNHREEFPLVLDLLRPGGILYVTTPNFASASRRFLGPRWNVIVYPEHLVYFTPSTLTGFLTSVGFKKVWLETTGVSVSRLRESFQSKDAAKNVRARSKSEDLALRSALNSGGLGRSVKGAANWALSSLSLGDKIKAGFTR